MRTFSRHLIALGCVTALATAWPSAAFAWGEEGHEIVATAARDMLFARRPEFQQRFFAILQQDILDFSYSFVDRRTRETVHRNCSSDTIAKASIWADCVRNSQEHQHTGDFHFDDVPYCTDIPPMPPRTTYCRDENCGTGALEKYRAVLRNRRAPARERAEALVWIIHIVGDLHQPLHAVDNRDNGGNGIKLTFTRDVDGQSRSTVTKLHSFWDGDMVRHATRPANAGARVPTADRVRVIFDLANSNRARLVERDPAVWVQQSHALAQQAYRQLDPVPACNAGSENAAVTMAYVNEFKDDVAEQLAKAAVRLAHILEQDLS